jgi:AraC-like DNA-binding protein
VLRIFTWRNSFFIEPFPILLGPSIYLYVRSFRERISIREAFPHIALSLLFFIISFLFYYYLNEHYHDASQISTDIGRDPVGIAFAFLRLSWYIIYYFLTARALTSYERSFQQLFSNSGRIDLKWASWLNNGTIILVAFTFVVNIIMFIYPKEFTLLLLINIAIITPYLYVVSYKGITQSSLWRQMGFKQQELEQEMEDETRLESHKMADLKKSKATLTEEKIHELAKAIIHLMEDEKLYREAELTLQDLSETLHSSPHQVSQAINDELKKNFYDVINGYRVEEAKRLLIDPNTKNFTILSVGYEAGFNSKTTFNTVFKKFTGFTPGDYKLKNSETIPA